MRLDTFALALVVVFALLWLVTAVTGLIVAVPFGLLGLIPIAVLLSLLAAVIHQRLHNKEDDYYDKHVDQ